MLNYIIWDQKVPTKLKRNFIKDFSGKMSNTAYESKGLLK